MNIRISFLFGIALIVSFTVAAYANQPVATLKAQAQVNGDIVKLGDLLDNAGPAAAIPVFHAPEFGGSGTIQAHRIIEAARSNGVLLVDTNGLNEVIVRRAGRTIPVSEVEQAIAEAAARQIGRGEAKDLSVNFGNAVRPLLVEASSTEAPRITNFNYDARTQRFSGVIEVGDSAILRRSPVRVAGTLYETIEAVTLLRSLDRGETIRDSDIAKERRPRSEAGDALSSQHAVVGQAAKRALRQGQVLRSSDLMKPDLVSRNDTVTIVFESGGITLTARGKALASGAEGETISVLNPQSKRTLQGVVDKPGVVIVSRNALSSAETTATVR